MSCDNVRMDTTYDSDWITLAQAAALVPSPRRGKKTHVSTLLRWILQGKLAGYRRGRWWMIRRQELLDLIEPTEVVPCRLPATAGELKRRQRELDQWTAATLKKHGVTYCPAPP